MQQTWLQVTQWSRYEGLLHGFLGRRGGSSAGPYWGLNLSFRVGDDSDVVKNNVCDMKKAVGIHDARIITMRQVHGERIIEVVDKNIKEAGEADGMLTRQTEAYLGVLTADCVPVLFLAPEDRVVAVAHAGWRGSVAGIGEKMVCRLNVEYGIPPHRIEAALGPAIGACCYQVGEDVLRPLFERWGELGFSATQQREGRTYLDLRRLNRAILEQAGVTPDRVFEVGACTSCSPDEFFSYRREKKETGRQMSFIGWRPETP